ncbi:MAG: nuclear transport factor 2 family protein [Myxococcales bacterium]|nr:nuclear transport factor 2 family protein [Myxococcales bacterium]
MVDLPAPVARYLAAYNAIDVDAMLATMADDIIFDHVSNATESVRTEGKESLEQLARQTASLMSARTQTVRQAVCQEQGELTRCALLVDYEAVVAMDLPDGLERGQVLRLRGASFFELRGDLITRITDLS